MLIGVSDPAIVFFFERVLRRIRIRVAPQPELLDELFALFVGLQSQERTALFRRNDVNGPFRPAWQESEVCRREQFE